MIQENKGAGWVGWLLSYRSNLPTYENLVRLKGLNNLTNLTNLDLEALRHSTLKYYRGKQKFRVSVGKSKWIDYEEFNPEYNLREVLDDEIVIEFDCDDLEIVCKAISQTGINLYNAGIEFTYWEHGGRSPHLHIHDLPISQLSPEERKQFKKIFIRKYVPLEFLDIVDISLTGIHLVRLEWAPCWKGKYGIKKLISVFDGANKQSWGVCDK